jgi:hypothetical protein
MQRQHYAHTDCMAAREQMHDNRTFRLLTNQVACGMSSTASGFTRALRSPGGSPR